MCNELPDALEPSIRAIKNNTVMTMAEELSREHRT